MSCSSFQTPTPLSVISSPPPPSLPGSHIRYPSHPSPAQPRRTPSHNTLSTPHSSLSTLSYARPSSPLQPIPLQPTPAHSTPASSPLHSNPAIPKPRETYPRRRRMMKWPASQPSSSDPSTYVCMYVIPPTYRARAGYRLIGSVGK